MPFGHLIAPGRKRYHSFFVGLFDDSSMMLRSAQIRIEKLLLKCAIATTQMKQYLDNNIESDEKLMCSNTVIVKKKQCKL